MADQNKDMENQKSEDAKSENLKSEEQDAEQKAADAVDKEAINKEDAAGEEVEDAEDTSKEQSSEDGSSEKVSAEKLSSEDLENDEEAEKSGLKSKLFGKGEKKENAKLKEQIAELNDKVVRQMAEFDNFRKRTDKEKQQMFETGAKSVIEKILPVVDNFERGLATIPEEEKGSAFAEGMSMIYKQLMTELEKLDVKPIEAVGKEFDPNFHNAVMHVEDESLGENVIVDELQKGYTYRDSVVRHSMVRVAN